MKSQCKLIVITDVTLPRNTVVAEEEDHLISSVDDDLEIQQILRPGASAEDADNIMICAFTTVKKNRGSQKYKLVLKHGVMTIDSRDYVFRSLTGEATW